MRRAALGCSLLLATLASGCAHRAADRIPEPWRFEAQATRGEVRVLPVLGLHGELPVELGSFVGLPIPYERERLRAARTRQMEAVPRALGEQLPGAVNGLLGPGWTGQFRHGAWPLGAQDRLRLALEGNVRKGQVDDILGELASGIGTDATLFTWVREVEGQPVSSQGFPGTTVETPVGPVLVNHRDEAYVVTLRVGLALVTGEGEVLIRYEHDYQTLLSGGLDEADAAGDLAGLVAADVTKVWATEAELNRTTTVLAQESW